MNSDDMPPIGWEEEWEIVDFDQPAQRVSVVEAVERMSRSFMESAAGASFLGLFTLVILGKISGNQFTACFVALAVATGGAVVVTKHPELLLYLARLGRGAFGALEAEKGRRANHAGQQGHDEDDPDEAEDQ